MGLRYLVGPRDSVGEVWCTTTLLSIAQAIYQSMKADVRVGSDLSDAFEARMTLDSTSAPAL